nr:DUF4301 family protein [uncultured Flavobacterium sp.]
MQQKNIVEQFSKKDLSLLKNLDIDLNKIQRQYNRCLTGTIPAVLDRVATIYDGILQFEANEKNEYISFFNQEAQKYNLEKFVPASGAATRMFKFLLEFLRQFNPEQSTLNSYINKYQCKDLNTFLVGLDKFSFYDAVVAQCKVFYPDYDSASQDHKYYYFIKVLIDSDFLNYSAKPKALIPFHKINNKLTTPLHKHVSEALAYSVNKNTAKVHFTVTQGFEKYFQEIINQFDQNIEVSYSNQLPKTDSLAFDLENEPFRSNTGDLLFRPGGHGALIENLNQLTSDIIFIKNIDNVSFNHFTEIVDNKKFLGGILIKTQQKIFSILKQLDRLHQIKETNDVLLFMKKELNIYIPENIKNSSDIKRVKQFIIEKLDRPIRVCGMVKNEGEPGGGPFWVKDANGHTSLQIIETSQIDTNNVSQKLILSQSTHFNPVDIVCGVKNYQGKKFDLNNFIDHSTGFVVYKSHEGRNLKSYELPGLWNGAMANWISIFVEVPLATFNPVKTVNDLLKPAHQHA